MERQRHTISSKNGNLRLAMRLAKIGVTLVPMIVVFPLWRIQIKFYETDWWPKLLKRVFEHLGPLWIKIGQWLSTTDKLSLPIRRIFSDLQSKVRPHTFEYTKKVIEEFTGKELSFTFSDFSEIPVGSGSVAQVYKATDKKSGDIVAVKILHPNVRENLLVDLRIIELFGNLLLRIPGLNVQDLAINQEIETFHDILIKQTDLTIEGANLIRFGNNFATNPSIIIPKFFQASNEVLVESFEEGIPLRTIIQNGPTCIDESIAANGLDAFVQMLIKDNLTHCDLHSGNIFVKFLNTKDHHAEVSQELIQTLDRTSADPEKFRGVIQEIVNSGYQPQLIVLDVGLSAELKPVNIDTVRQCFLAGVNSDAEGLAEILIKRSRYPSKVINKALLVDKLSQMMDSLTLDQRGELLLSKIFAAEIVRSFTKLIRAHHVTLEGDFSSLFIAGLITEGLGRTLHSDLDILPTLANYLELV